VFRGLLKPSLRRLLDDWLQSTTGPVIDLGIVAEAAAELGLNEIHVEPEIELRSGLAGNGTGGRAVAGDAVIGSALDLPNFKP